MKLSLLILTIAVFASVHASPSEDDCNAMTTDTTCNGLAGCSWCVAGAVPSACHTVDDAKKLPVGVFQCSNLNLIKEGGSVWTVEEELRRGLHFHDASVSNAHERLGDAPLPREFTWGNVSGVNYLTMSRNQHLPQYCGSCWAHGSVSALGDRIKIARGAKGIDINLSVQHILNCGGSVGSCHGGSILGPYQWLKSLEGGISYETSNPYLACSSESTEGFCAHANTKCEDSNLRSVAYTCSTFSEMGGFCAAIDHYPNATISDYGSVQGADNMAKEIYANGPIACGIDAGPTLKYTGGIMSDSGEGVDHVVSVVGWGFDEETNKEYWIVRNSWGEYWGEMGYIRVEKGNNALKLETSCAWAIPDTFTETNYPCYEGGENCKTSSVSKPHPRFRGAIK